MPMYSQTDLSIQHAFRMGGAKQLQVELNIPTCSTRGIATNRFVDDAEDERHPFDESEFYKGNVNFDPLIAAMPKDPRFLMDSGFQAPIQARFGVKFLF